MNNVFTRKGNMTRLFGITVVALVLSFSNAYAGPTLTMTKPAQKVVEKVVTGEQAVGIVQQLVKGQLTEAAANLKYGAMAPSLIAAYAKAAELNLSESDWAAYAKASKDLTPEAVFVAFKSSTSASDLISNSGPAASAPQARQESNQVATQGASPATVFASLKFNNPKATAAQEKIAAGSNGTSVQDATYYGGLAQAIIASPESSCDSKCKETHIQTIGNLAAMGFVSAANSGGVEFVSSLYKGQLNDPQAGITQIAVGNGLFGATDEVADLAAVTPAPVQQCLRTGQPSLN